jgi:cytochrome P450
MSERLKSDNPRPPEWEAKPSPAAQWKTGRPLPVPDAVTSLKALKAMLRERHPLAAMQVFHRKLGDVFQITLPGFSPIVMVGPQAARFILVESQDDLRWRNEGDPVTDLLRHGVLVEDGELHDHLRRLMNPVLHRRMLDDYVSVMIRRTDQVVAGWKDWQVVDMLEEMRKIALLILVETMFQADLSPELGDLWKAVLDTLRFISPGFWMFWRGAPRPQYKRSIQTLDSYLYRLIGERRRLLGKNSDEPHDLLGLLITSGLPDDLIRDQLLTILIAGHDTSTALMSWTLYLLGKHPWAILRAEAEARSVLGDLTPELNHFSQLPYLGQVIDEVLRLYPPIHLGTRLAARDLEYDGYQIPAGKRVIYSIYLTQRHPDYWPDPDRFDPDRHAAGVHKPPYAWLPFGGGPRNCIGAAFGQVEARLVVGRILQQVKLVLIESRVYPHMGATLEPSPGVRMLVRRLP